MSTGNDKPQINTLDALLDEFNLTDEGKLAVTRDMIHLQIFSILGKRNSLDEIDISYGSNARYNAEFGSFKFESRGPAMSSHTWQVRVLLSCRFYPPTCSDEFLVTLTGDETMNILNQIQSIIAMKEL